MTLNALENSIKEEVGVLLYFSGEHCSVCHALRPKFKLLFDTKFPKMKQIYLDAQEYSALSSHFQVLSLPTIILFLDGREFRREGRLVSLYQLEETLTRPYKMLTES
ncbi:thioredoxin-like [hydrothermal vent metagenome]|uniref:Thioredoxin-like n=1 Tax=hydrothermal vent metagenome TaxID=652676 RepID=A0A1W1BLX4_9ZZZZ